MQKEIKQLKGHSGCNIILVNDNGSLLVKKISAGQDYNIRLKKQFIKQKIYSSPIINAPKIYNYGLNHNGLFYFDMEFVSGKTFAEYLPEISITEIADYVRCVFENLYIDAKSNNNTTMAFKIKILDLEKKLADKNQLKEAFQTLNIFDWSIVNKSFCHGDLTLENILITYDKKLYLIDFLDSFYNSWMIDFAKLLQDVDLKWSYREKELNTNQSLRLEIARMALIEEILKLKNGREILNAIYHILLLNVIRIYPYTFDTKTLDFLDNSINKCLKNINEIKKGV